MGKDLKIKQSVFSPPYKVWVNIFHRKALHGGTNFFEQIFFGNVLRLMIRSCKGEVNDQEVSKVGSES